MFRFSIRELMLVTLTVGLAVAWCVDRSRLATLTKEAESSRTLSEALAIQLRSKNLGSNIQIIVDGDIVRIRKASDPSLFAKYPPEVACWASQPCWAKLPAVESEAWNRTPTNRRSTQGVHH
jgi:hypothetical protein